MPQPADFSRRTFLVLVACVTAAAACIRFWHLSFRSLWIDEGVSVALARMNWSDFFHALWIREANMALYYLVLRGWIHITDSEFGLRALSVIIAIITVPLVALLGERLYSRRAGLLAAALFAVHVWQIYHAREVRGYSMLVLLSVLGWLQLTAILRRPSWRNWLLFAAISVASVYINFFAVLGVLAQLACAVLSRPRDVGKSLTVTTVLIGIGCLPAAVFVLIRDVGQLVWVQKTNGPGLVEFFDLLTGGWSGSYAAMIFAVVEVALLIVGIRAVRRSESTPFAIGVPLLGVLVPLVLLVLISFARPSFVPRYLIMIAVPFVLGIAWLCSRLPDSAYAPAGIALLAIFLVPLPAYYRQPAFQDFRGAAQYLSQHAKPADGLVVWEPMARTGLEFYTRGTAGFPEFQYPHNANHLIGEDLEGKLDPVEMKRRLSGPDRIWLVYNFDEAPADYGTLPYFFQVQAEQGRRLVTKATFKNIQILEYVRP